MAEISWLDRLATRADEQVLLIGADREWTVAAVHAGILGLRSRLAECRVVAVLADNSPAWVVADLAAQEAGVVHLPLPAFFTPAQLRHALVETGADALLTDQPERIGALDLGFANAGHWEGLTWMRRVVDAVALPPGTVKITFTSGSTGAPKGVCLSGAGLHDTARAVCERLADLPLQRHLAVMPLSLLLENVAGVYAPLLRGMRVHLPPLATIGWKGMAGFDPASLDRAVGNCDASSVILVPELLKAWAIYLAATSRRAAESLAFVAVGGARVALEQLRAARRLGIPAYQGYGLSEGGSVLTLNRPGDDSDAVGRPLAHARLRIENGEVVTGARAFLGYIGSAAVGGEGFATGDIGRFDADGQLHLGGRRSNLLVTSFGRNVSPEWIEAELLADPRILQAIVVGDALPALAAIVVARPGVPDSEIDAIVAHINRGLPDYARLAHWLPAEPFTTQNGLATGNGRPARNRIIEHHYLALAERYEEASDVVL